MLSCVLPLTADPIHVKELKVGDKTYEDVTVTEQDETGIHIMHSVGVTQISWSELTNDQKKALGYDDIQKKMAADKASQQEATQKLLDTLNEHKKLIATGGLTMDAIKTYLQDDYKLRAKISKCSWEDYIFEMLGKPANIQPHTKVVSSAWGPTEITRHDWTWNDLVKDTDNNQEVDLIISDDSPYGGAYCMISNGVRTPLSFDAENNY